MKLFKLAATLLIGSCVVALAQDAAPSRPGAAGGGAANRRRGAITEANKAEIRLALNSYLKPFLVA